MLSGAVVAGNINSTMVQHAVGNFKGFLYQNIAALIL